jgi:hypothetical protein
MDRRKALTLTATILGTSLIGSQVFLAGCSGKGKPILSLSDSDIAFLNEVGETILPQCDHSPGAKAANVGQFMKTIVSDCYSEEEGKIFYSGIERINEAADYFFSKRFMKLSTEEREELLISFDTEARNQDNSTHFFSMMKQLTLWGFFSSEVGVTKALRYNPIPGRFEGCIPYNEEPAWS